MNNKFSVTKPMGFKASSLWCGIKKEKIDLTIIVSDFPAVAAAVFTTNVCCAAPVTISKQNLKSEKTLAILTNSGNANAATGVAGIKATEKCVQKCAQVLKCNPAEILVASTGIIGKVLPAEKVVSALEPLCQNLSAEGGDLAAVAILTTDTFVKQSGCAITLSTGSITIGAMAKGSGMIMPNMATMLGYITTDLAIEKAQLQSMLAEAVKKSFNRISVDGDTSTNDSVFMLANGASGVALATQSDCQLFQAALDTICIELAQLIVRDAEGATKFVTIEVAGCKSEADADIIGRTIANSPLVKTALYGENPNWGRILAATGRSGVKYDQDGVSLYINDIKTVVAGVDAGVPVEQLSQALKATDIYLKLVLSEGVASAILWSCDLTHAYIDINVAYS